MKIQNLARNKFQIFGKTKFKNAKATPNPQANLADEVASAKAQAEPKSLLEIPTTIL